MHPELSLVFLTVLGGIGQGIFIVLFVLTGISPLPESLIFLGLGVSLILQMLGTASSLLHLGHPFRVWKAIRMLKTSWLSREVMSGGIAFGFTFLYFLSYFLDYGFIGSVIGYIAFLGALSFLISSSMLYASIRFIREWSNASTPFMFFFMGLTGGIAVVYTLLWFMYPLGEELLHSVGMFLIVFGFISLVFKLIIYLMINRFYVPFNLHSALGVRGNAEIVQMDMGTPYEHFNTKDFSYPISKEKLRSAKFTVILLAFLVPLILWLILALGDFGNNISLFISLVSFLIMLSGFILERRLFFIQGNHIQNLYYNRFNTNKVMNPLLSRARRGTPVP